MPKRHRLTLNDLPPKARSQAKAQGAGGPHDLADVVLDQWRLEGKTDLPVRELKFHPSRKWRFDLAWPDAMVAVELHGGTRGEGSRGAHVRAEGIRNDAEKARAAALLGWTLLAYTDLDLRDHGAGRIWEDVQIASLRRTSSQGANEIVSRELCRARQKHPFDEDAPVKPFKAVAILVEEVGEVANALLENRRPEEIDEEIAQVAAVAFRMLDEWETARRSTR